MESGRVPNLYFRSLPREALRAGAHGYRALPELGDAPIRSPDDYRYVPQDTHLWSALHARYLTGRDLPAALGLLDAAAAPALRLAHRASPAKLGEAWERIQAIERESRRGGAGDDGDGEGPTPSRGAGGDGGGGGGTDHGVDVRGRRTSPPASASPAPSTSWEADTEDLSERRRRALVWCRRVAEAGGQAVRLAWGSVQEAAALAFVAVALRQSHSVFEVGLVVPTASTSLPPGLADSLASAPPIAASPDGLLFPSGVGGAGVGGTSLGLVGGRGGRAGERGRRGGRGGRGRGPRGARGAPLPPSRAPLLIPTSAMLSLGGATRSAAAARLAPTQAALVGGPPVPAPGAKADSHLARRDSSAGTAAPTAGAVTAGDGDPTPSPSNPFPPAPTRGPFPSVPPIVLEVKCPCPFREARRGGGGGAGGRRDGAGSARYRCRRPGPAAEVESALAEGKRGPGVRPEWAAQIQFQMLCCGAGAGILAVHSPVSGSELFLLPRDDAWLRDALSSLAALAKLRAKPTGRDPRAALPSHRRMLVRLREVSRSAKRVRDGWQSLYGAFLHLDGSMLAAGVPPRGDGPPSLSPPGGSPTASLTAQGFPPFLLPQGSPLLSSPLGNYDGLFTDGLPPCRQGPRDDDAEAAAALDSLLLVTREGSDGSDVEEGGRSRGPARADPFDEVVASRSPGGPPTRCPRGVPSPDPPPADPLVAGRPAAESLLVARA